MAAPKDMHICSIVPPHLLQAIANSDANRPEHRAAARLTLVHVRNLVAKRTAFTQALSQPRELAYSQSHPHKTIVPEHILQAIVDSPETGEDDKACAQRGLDHIRKIHVSHVQSQLGSLGPIGGQEKPSILAAAADTKTKGKSAVAAPASAFYRAVYDARKDEDEGDLPGVLLRTEGQPPVSDQNANDAYDNVGKMLQFYKTIFKWNSIDNKGMHVVSSVHFGTEYENAFWDPYMMQMVYGDGGSFLTHFCECVDVIAHEMTHAVTEHTSPLDYQDQPGALNEHVSDVFGIMCKQWAENETSAAADWLIGEGCLMPGIKGVALRSMKAPGTACNDPRLVSTDMCPPITSPTG